MTTGVSRYTNQPSSSRLLGNSSSRNIMINNNENVTAQQIENSVDYNHATQGSKSVFTIAGYESTINKSKQLVMQPQHE